MTQAFMPLEFKSTFFDGKTSKAHTVIVNFDGRFLQIKNELIETSARIEDCQIEPPLGSSLRVIRLPNGAKLETDALETVALLEQQIGRNKGLTFVNKLEKSWRLVLGSFVGMVVFLALFLRFGLPIIADQVAFVTPTAVLSPITDQTMNLLDGQVLKPTTLSLKRQQELERVFQKIVNDIGGTDYSYQLEFRSSPEIGANAFALPSGKVVMTDELVQLSDNDLEIRGVLAHEIGHVIKRHALRSLYQGTGVFLMISILAGDVSGLASLATALPAVLINSGYSRTFEREADEVAGKYLRNDPEKTKPLRDILEKLTSSHSGSSGTPGFLSTHPGTDERIKNLKAIENAP
jgi:Zn-dependent protease with chaperone function